MCRFTFIGKDQKKKKKKKKRRTFSEKAWGGPKGQVQKGGKAETGRTQNRRRGKGEKMFGIKIHLGVPKKKRQGKKKNKQLRGKGEPLPKTQLKTNRPGGPQGKMITTGKKSEKELCIRQEKPFFKGKRVKREVRGITKKGNAIKLAGKGRDRKGGVGLEATVERRPPAERRVRKKSTMKKRRGLKKKNRRESTSS